MYTHTFRLRAAIYAPIGLGSSRHNCSVSAQFGSDRQSWPCTVRSAVCCWLPAGWVSVFGRERQVKSSRSSGSPSHRRIVSISAGQPVYQISLDKFDPFTATGKDYFDPGTLRIVRKGRNNFVLAGNFSLAKNMGNEIIVNMHTQQADQYTSNRTKPSSIRPQVKCQSNRKQLNGKMVKVFASMSPLCDQIANDDHYYPILSKSSNFPMPAPCPFPKGEYIINNFKVDEEFLPTLLPLGEYVIEVHLMLNEEMLFGYIIHATISS